MTEYGKIETLYERDETTHRLKPELILKNRVYGIIKSWVFTEKIDGTNIRAIWHRWLAQCGHCVVSRDHNFCQECGQKIVELREEGRLEFGGKTDNAQIHADLVKYLYATVTPEKMSAAFPADVGEVVLYGEGYGAGIQKGGGNYSPTKRFILFDVLVAGWWLSDENMRDVAQKLGIEAVPLVGEMTLEEATEMVRKGFPSKLGAGAPAEGLVGRPVEALFDKKGSRLIVKLKTKDF